MRKQYAVFGLGNFGKHLALGLENLGCEVVVVDNSMEKIQEIADKVSYAMCANIEDPEVIKSLGARNLDGAVMQFLKTLEQVLWLRSWQRRLEYHMYLQKHRAVFMRPY